MKYRPQRGGLSESLSEVLEVNPPTMWMLKMCVMEKLTGNLPDFNGKIEVKPYCYDARIGWDTHIVTVDGQGVGFTDGPCTESGQ